MKTCHFIAAFAALALLSLAPLHAQGRHEINFYGGGPNPEYEKLQIDPIVGDLSALYEPQYQASSSGTFTLDYHYALNNWFRVGFQADYCNLKTTRTYQLGNVPKADFEKHMFSLLPQAKFNFTRMRHFRPYASVGVGVQLNAGTYEGKAVNFAWEVVPIGAEWGGNRVYGTAALCYGSVITGGRIGIGFRF